MGGKVLTSASLWVCVLRPELANYTLFLKEQFYKNSEAQICPKIKNKLRTIEVRRCFYMWRFVAGLSTVKNTE